LQRVQSQDIAPELHLLARQVAAQALEQRRLEEQMERQSQQLRDAQRRADQLQDRLEALRALERARPNRPTP
jgi:chromosome segregation ATPase